MSQHTQPHTPNNHGFSLAEMAMAIVMVGLLAGGVVVGQDMVRGAKLRDVMEEKEEYVSAINHFYDKYRKLPGDYDEATSLWSAHADCGGKSKSDTATCNGNGDGKINNGLMAVFGFEGGDEWFYAWRHLINAGLMKGSLTGQPGPNGMIHTVVSTNIPESSLSGAGWTLLDLGGPGNGVIVFDGSYHTTLWLGASNDVYNLNVNPVLSATEMYEIDQKMDDGMPATGKLVSFTGEGLTHPFEDLNPGCAYTTSGSNAQDIDAEAVYGVGQYNFNSKQNDIVCTMIFKQVVLQ